jgi:serine/threonine protein kinase/tetratricopeptide (TPR) repeat protein
MKCPRCRADNPDTSHFCAACGTGLGTSPETGAPQTHTLQIPAQSPLIGTLFAGKYKILRELGRGGMGEVYLAEDVALDRTVALKLLPEEKYRDPESRARLVREAKAAAALDHPYVCSIHEVGESEGRVFFVMEYVEGLTLRERIAQGPIPVRQALEIALEAGEALQSAHEKDLVHRDIKPANIMLMDKGHTKVMDFGLAKVLAGGPRPEPLEEVSATLTKDGLSPGTPAYMSPEQLLGEELDQRSDIFSFGMVLYEMLAGVHPFRGETGFTTASAILKGSPRPLADLTAGIPEPLQKVLDKMLAKEPQNRYPSMTSVLADLRNIRSGLQAEGKIMKFLKPARVALTAGVLAVAVLAAGWLAKTLFFKSPAEALAFQARDWILIADFENLTGEPVFDRSLETALTVGIQQSQYVNVFPPSRIQETLRRMRRLDVKKVDETIGREIALREGIKGLLACSISKVGDNYLLTARIIDPDKQIAVYSASSRAKGKEEVLGSLDELAGKLRRALGESMVKISQQKMNLVQATTSSLEALKYYTESLAAPGDTSYYLLNQAIELDPDFALAHLEIGIKCYIIGNRPEGEKHFQKALSLRGRLTAREKLWIQAIVEDWRGNRDQGIQNYKLYLAQYPDDSAAWFRVGYAYLVSNQPALGIEAFKKVIAIDSASAGAYVNMASCLNTLKKDEEALANYQKAFSLDPDFATGSYVNNEYGFLLVRMGKIQEARRTFEKMISQQDNFKKARGNRSLGLLLMYQGQYSAAQDCLKEAVNLNKTLQVKLSEMRDHLFLAINYNRKRQREAFEKEMMAVNLIQKEIKIDPVFLYKIGKIYARLNRLTEAGQLFEKLKSRMGDVLAQSGINRSNQSDQASFYLLKGEIELAQKRFEEAAGTLGLADNLRTQQLEDSLAFAYFKSGNVDKAIEKYKDFLETDVLGYEGQELWILAHYQLGRLYEQKGESAEAVKYYERFLDIWKDADPDLTEFADAQKRLARLKSGGL